MIRVISHSKKQTQKVAASLVEELVKSDFTNRGAAVVALEGSLGSGKTTFAQGFARALGVRENVLSPTFVLMKIYPLKRVNPVLDPALVCKGGVKGFKHLIHIDCYRLGSPKDLLHLGFKNLLKDRDAVILVEWADRVKKLIPGNAIRIKFRHRGKFHERILKVSI